MIMEEWKDISGFEGYYQVSNLGRVRSLPRIQTVPNRYGGFHERKDDGRLLTPTDNGNGYKIVGLRMVNAKRRKFFVHRLVAEAFVPKRSGMDFVNHIDHDKTNNAASNLEWCTQEENARYSAPLMRHQKSKCMATNTGEKHIRFRNGRYHVCIDRMRIWKSFGTLPEAIAFRDEVIRDA